MKIEAKTTQIRQTLGEGIKPENLNDDRIARALDSCSNQGLTPLFTSIAMLAHQTRWVT